MNRTRGMAATSRATPAGGRAMTLVEVLAVVVILGLVAGTFLVGFSGSLGKAKHELAKSGISLIAGRIELYRMEAGQWPSNDDGLGTLSDPQADPSAVFYLSQDQLLDPWNRPYLYLTPGPDGHPYEVLTYGADGRVGGTGEDADVSSVNLRRVQP